MSRKRKKEYKYKNRTKANQTPSQLENLTQYSPVTSKRVKVTKTRPTWIYLAKPMQNSEFKRVHLNSVRENADSRVVSLSNMRQLFPYNRGEMRNHFVGDPVQVRNTDTAFELGLENLTRKYHVIRSCMKGQSSTEGYTMYSLRARAHTHTHTCLLYTSDAADER